MWRGIVWAVAGALSAYACALVVRHGTPVDEALPLIAIVITAVAAASHPSIQLAVPMAMVAELIFVEERTRLIAIGLIAGLAIAAALLARGNAIAIAIASIVLLRWIPLADVMWGREITLLLIAAGIVLVFRRTPLAAAIAVIVALTTPAIPLRSLAVPLAVLIAGVVIRLFWMPAIALSVPSALVLAITVTFFAWSGAFARAMPLLLRPPVEAAPREPMNMALRPGESVVIAVEPGARAVILSGANMGRLKKGTVVGRIDPGGRVVRIGDIADWGALRREHSWNARNTLPRDPAGRLRGYGQNAWFDGAGRIVLSVGTYRVTADASLPAQARLQIDSIEMEEP